MEACIIPQDWMINNKLYMITSSNEDDLRYLCAFLNSKLFSTIVLKNVNFGGGKGIEFIGNIKLPKMLKKNSNLDEISFASIYGLSKEEIEFIESQ